MSLTNILDRAVLHSTPDPSYSGIAGFWHCVQLYEKDSFLCETVGRFIDYGLAAGEGVIVIATAPHRLGFEETLRAKGWDLDSCRGRGQYVPMDAAETLAQFMADGSPDPERFDRVVGRLVEKIAATGNHRRVRAFGEMVAILWKAGEQRAALRLEELWNQLGQSHPLSLLCAYPMDSFRDPSQTEGFQTICGDHSHVIPTEDYVGLPNQDERLKAIAELQQRAISMEGLAGKLIQAQDAERSQLGHTLHEDVNQKLALLSVNLDMLRTDQSISSPALTHGLTDLWQQVNEITSDVCSLSSELHPSMLKPLGLVPALKRLIADFSARQEIKVEFAPVPTPIRITSEVALCLFRVAQECLNNIAKHSGALSARVRLAIGANAIHLTVEDAGVGFDPKAVGAKAGLGIVNMRERLRSVKGNLRIHSSLYQGTRIEVWVPAVNQSNGAATPP